MYLQIEIHFLNQHAHTFAPIHINIYILLKLTVNKNKNVYHVTAQHFSTSSKLMQDRANYHADSAISPSTIPIVTSCNIRRACT